MDTDPDYRIGIDFGTTTTSVSFRHKDGLAEALPIGENGRLYIPSIVYIPPGNTPLENRIVVGEPAARSAASGYVVHSVKRCLGCTGERCAESRSNGNTWCDHGQINLPEVGVFKPEVIAYHIVREALQRALRFVKDRDSVDLRDQLLTLDVNMGCSAAFSQAQRRLLIENVAHALDLKKVSWDNIVEEPILAGFTFSRFESQLEGRILIYDFGGGSFDAAILDIRLQKDKEQESQGQGKKQKRVITVLATAGENWLGGDDIDTLVRQHFIRQIATSRGLAELEVEAKLEPLDIWRLREFSQNAKEQLTEREDFQNSLFTDNLDVLDLQLSRPELERLILSDRTKDDNLINRSLDTVLRACKLVYALDQAQKSDLLDTHEIVKLSLADAAKLVDRVVPVGGVTKMPIVRSKLEDVFGADKIESETVIEPITAVAIGAAYPREPEHYSLAYPPYEIRLQLFESLQSTAKSQVVFEAYEYYDFHKEWATAGPRHRSTRIKLPKPSFARIGVRRISDSQFEWHDLGRLDIGEWEFQITLNGDIFLLDCNSASDPRHLFTHPAAHPVQRAISEARQARQAEEKKKGDSQIASPESIRMGYGDN